MLLAGTRDLIGIFLALELTSISQYILVGFHKDRLSSEAGLKYLLLGAIASAILLYGMAILLGLSGSTNLSVIAAFIAQAGSGQFEALILASVFLIVGFGFKAAIAPFQMWVPDVYQGGPTPIAAYLSVASKAAAFAVLIRVFFEALERGSAPRSLVHHLRRARHAVDVPGQCAGDSAVEHQAGCWPTPRWRRPARS